MRKRILFFAEAVTLAHIARPIALAKGLDFSRYEIFIACDPHHHRFLGCEPWHVLPLQSISSKHFLDALARGRPVYDVQTLRSYVRDDLKLIEKIKPDLIVGDFRLSLSVSARLVGIPYTNITNAYWSPYYARNKYPLPVLPITKVLPLSIAGVLFRLAQRLAFSLHCRPLNMIREENGLPSLGSDLRRIYTDGDYTLYADVREMFPIENLPGNHFYLGPVLWSPPVAKPEWWSSLPTNKPVIYLTLGSSGQSLLLPKLFDALSELPVTVLAATMRTYTKRDYPLNTYIADYLPGLEAAARAKLVICNGGSLTCQQAFVAGVPVLGIASNMDQFLNMEVLTKAGLATMLRADRLSVGKIRSVVTTMISCSRITRTAEKFSSNDTGFKAQRTFAAFVDKIMGE